MKKNTKFFIFLTLLIFVCLPFQGVLAKGLAEGPIIGSNFTLKSGETLNEDLIVMGGSVSIENSALVKGAVVLFGGSLTLDGEVNKDVVVLGGAVKLGQNSHIHGNLVTFGSALSRDAGAKIDGEVINKPDMPESPKLPSLPAYTDSVFQSSNPFLSALKLLGESIMLALLAVLFGMFLPLQMRRVADHTVVKPLQTFGMGLFSLIAFIIAIIALVLFSLLIITLIITVPLLALLCIIFASAVLLGWLSIGLEIGVRISRMFNREWPLPLAAGLGVFLLNLVSQGIGFIPCVGGLIAVVIGLTGLGSVLITRFGTHALQTVTKPLVTAETETAP
ncbi:MAG: hypothetical protein WCP19_08420 [Chloroflexota bacterium]